MDSINQISSTIQIQRHSHPTLRQSQSRDAIFGSRLESETITGLFELICPKIGSFLALSPCAATNVAWDRLYRSFETKRFVTRPSILMGATCNSAAELNAFSRRVRIWPIFRSPLVTYERLSLIWPPLLDPWVQKTKRHRSKPHS